MAREGVIVANVYCLDSRCIYNTGKAGLCVNKSAIRNIPSGCDTVHCDSCAKYCYDGDNQLKPAV